MTRDPGAELAEPRAAQEFRELMERRWSCRGFRDEPLPPALIHEMFDIARRTASWCNTQPWHSHVVSGAARDRLAKALIEHARDHEYAPDLPAPERYVGVYRERRREAGFQLYNSLGIERQDTAARTEQHLKNYQFFGAPHVAVITTDRNHGVYGAVDCGGYVANLLNAATSLGIATIPQAAIAMHPAPVREFLSIPDDRLVLCAISFGHADPDHPANGFRTNRGEVGDAVTYVND